MQAMASKRFLQSLAVAIAVALPAAAAVAAEPRNMTQPEVNASIRANPELYDPLFTAGVIRQVVKYCDSLDGPSRLQRQAYFMPLYLAARRAGYSRQQLENFVEDEGEREHMKALVEQYLLQQGVRLSDSAAVCAFGRQQIAAGTAIGQRLNER
jgi:hypothetical protein